MPPKGSSLFSGYSLYNLKDEMDRYTEDKVKAAQSMLSDWLIDRADFTSIDKEEVELPWDTNTKFVVNEQHCTESFIKGMETVLEVFNRDQLDEFIYNNIRVVSESTGRPVKPQYYQYKKAQYQRILAKYITFCRRVWDDKHIKCI